MEYRAWSGDEHSQAGVICGVVRVTMDGAVNVIMDGAVNVMGGAVNVGQMILLMPIVAICVNCVVLKSKKISYQGQSFL